jgi:acetyl-CoA/propionyl-CoA carboxylase biotin carboxyl carrier protein
VVSGDTIGINYDPLIAKVVACAESRQAALDRALAALRSFPVLGIRTNLSFLIALLTDERVTRGETHTGFVDEHLEELTRPPAVPLEAVAAAALLRRDGGPPGYGGHAVRRGPANAADPWTTLQGWGR